MCYAGFAGFLNIHCDNAFAFLVSDDAQVDVWLRDRSQYSLFCGNLSCFFGVRCLMSLGEVM